MIESRMSIDLRDSAGLAATVARDASLQTYLTIRLLVERERRDDAFRAYAYFRWVDDCLDQILETRSDRLAFILRQRALIQDCYSGREATSPSIHERMLVDLVHDRPDQQSGLARYVHNLMWVMAFDAERRGRRITRSELRAYTHSLAIAVAEALQYFLGPGDPHPLPAGLHFSVMGAHVAHMLRDTWADNRDGYYNIPVEFLDENHVSPFDLESPRYREWVRGRVAYARSCFSVGHRHVLEAGRWKFRLAEAAYRARFEAVLRLIERDGYILRPAYPERKSLAGALRLSSAFLGATLSNNRPAAAPGILGTREIFLQP